MAATGAPADEAIKTTQQMIDTTLDEVEKMLLRLPPRCIIPSSLVVSRTGESLPTTTVVSTAITTANAAQFTTAHSSEANSANKQSQKTVTTVPPMVTTGVSPVARTAPSPIANTFNSAREHHNHSISASLTTAVSPMAKTAVSPMTETAVSPMTRTARSTNRQRSQSVSSSIHTAGSPMERIATSPVNRQPVCPNTAPPTRPQSFVLPQPRTSTPDIRRPTQSASSSAVHTAISPMAKTARSPIAKTAHSSSEMVDVTSAFVLQGPVTITSHENVAKREDGLVYMNELIELRGAGATGMPGNELQPRIYSRATPTSAKEAVDFKETVKVGDNVVRIQRSTSLNPAGPPSMKLSEFALSELRIYPYDGSSVQTPSTSEVPDQLVRIHNERDGGGSGGGVDIEFNINVKRNKGTSTTSAKIKCDCPGFIPSKVWVNDRQVWAATTDN